MSNWKNKIIDAFVNHYFLPADARDKERKVLRIRSSLLFPDFETAPADEKESYLEAAESLERKGLVKLRWEGRTASTRKKERLKTLSCENFEMLFWEAGRPLPKTEAENIRAMLRCGIAGDKPNASTFGSMAGCDAFLQFLSQNFGPREMGQGIDRQTIKDLISLVEFVSVPARITGMTTRALSILLYRDSKHLENLLALCKPLLSRAEKTVPVPNLSFLERSYPETMISGKFIIEYKNREPAATPLINAEGHILGIPLEHAEEIKSIKPLTGKDDKTKLSAGKVLTIENKETFYAIGTPAPGVNKGFTHYDCFLYIGGYSNRAAAALIKILAASGFDFYHAGDLDPDGILILQNIREIAGKPVTPVRMDEETFDHYRPWARTLAKPMLVQIKKIKEETKAIPGIALLLRQIEETGLGVEQEIIDYR